MLAHTGDVGCNATNKPALKPAAGDVLQMRCPMPVRVLPKYRLLGAKLNMCSLQELTVLSCKESSTTHLHFTGEKELRAVLQAVPEIRLPHLSAAVHAL
jgi:hypothetical protein